VPGGGFPQPLATKGCNLTLWRPSLARSSRRLVVFCRFDLLFLSEEGDRDASPPFRSRGEDVFSRLGSRTPFLIHPGNSWVRSPFFLFFFHAISLHKLAIAPPVCFEMVFFPPPCQAFFRYLLFAIKDGYWLDFHGADSPRLTFPNVMSETLPLPPELCSAPV